jgi:hypothetical protein
MKNEDGISIASTLAERLEASASATRSAEAVVSALREVDVALAPVIGKRAVAALFNRSIRLSSVAYPWLTAAHEKTKMAIDLDALRQIFAQKDIPAIADCGGAILLKIQELLADLVGRSLAERLLRSGGTPIPENPSTMDTSL